MIMMDFYLSLPYCEYFRYNSIVLVFFVNINLIDILLYYLKKLYFI